MDRRIAKTREAIHKAYMDLVIEKGANTITVSELARRANIDRKTFYLHYSSPSDVMVEYVENRFSEIVSAMEAGHYFEDPFNVESLIDLLDSFYKEEEPLLLAIAGSDACYDFWEQVHCILAGKVVEFYAPLMKMSKEEIRVYFDFFGPGVINVYHKWAQHEYNFDIRSLIEMLRVLLQPGIYHLFKSDSPAKE